MRRLTEENVLLQMQHLRTHPSVAGAMAREELTISGWVYDIGKGEVRISEDGGRVFRPVTTEGERMIVPRAQQVKIRMLLWYVGKPLLILVVYDLSVVVAYKVLHWDWVALPHIPLTSVWVGDRSHCGVSEPVVVCAMVGGADAMGCAGEQLA